MLDLNTISVWETIHYYESNKNKLTLEQQLMLGNVKDAFTIYSKYKTNKTKESLLRKVEQLKELSCMN